jgi:dUTP pyrophosphatase
MSFFYLASPIDRANGAVKLMVGEVIDELREQLSMVKHVMFTPSEGFSVGYQTAPNRVIELVNQTAQENADGLFVIWPKNARSWGVPVEVERAIQRKQPVVFLWDRDSVSWAMPQAWLDSELFESFDMTDDLQSAVTYAIDWMLSTVEDQKVTRGQKGIPVLKLGEGAQIPTRAYSDDAGFDLYVSEDSVVQPGEFVDIPCAVAVELPAHTWALLTGRSSTLRKKRLLVNQGVIDPGYRGELFAGVWNLSNEPVEVKAGERVAQLIPMHNQALNLNLFEVEQLSPHPRGEQGFGSSGQ